MVEEEIPQEEGLHIISTFYKCKCSKNFLIKSNYVISKLKQFVDEVTLTPVEQAVYQFANEFEQNGYSGVILLAESHLAIHTWPEEERVNVQVYVCNYKRNNQDKAKILFQKIQELFQPEELKTKEVVE